MILGSCGQLEHVMEMKLKATAMNLSNLTDTQLIAVKDKYAKLGVRGIQSNGYCNLISVDEAVRESNIRATKENLLAASKAGCESVITGGGHRNPQEPEAVYSIHVDNWGQNSLDVLVDSCTRILSDLDIGDTKLCLETWVMTPLDSPEAVQYVLNKVNHKNLKICFDPVNLMNLQRYFTNGVFMLQCLDAFGDAIQIVHLKDTKLLPKPHTYHMSEELLGKGNLDFRALLRGCSQLRSDLPLYIEHVSQAEMITQSVEYIQNLASEMDLKFN